MEYKYKIEDWVLYDKILKNEQMIDSTLNQRWMDVKETTQSLRVFGTKEQIKEASKNYNIDEAYDYKLETKGSYWEGIIFCDDPGSNKPTLREYNETYHKKYNKYLEWYKKNDYKILIINML